MIAVRFGKCRSPWDYQKSWECHRYYQLFSFTGYTEPLTPLCFRERGETLYPPVAKRRRALACPPLEGDYQKDRGSDCTIAVFLFSEGTNYFDFGKTIVNSLPTSLIESTKILPFIFSIISFVIQRPSPVPIISLVASFWTR